MASKAQKKKAAADLAMYFAEKGYIVSGRDYNNDPLRPRHLKLSIIRKLFRNWSGMVAAAKSYEPELMEGLTDTKPKAVDPLVELQAKTAEKAEDEGDDGEDI